MTAAATIPAGLCQCGCGQPTRPAARTRTERGNRAGAPLRYRHGHNAGRARIGPPDEQAAAPRCAGGCGYPLTSHHGNQQPGHRRHAARGLCDSCRRRAITDGTYLDHPPMTRSRDELLEDWDVLRCSGVTRTEAARRLGISCDALERAIYRGRGAGDPRAVLGNR